MRDFHLDISAYPASVAAARAAVTDWASLLPAAARADLVLAVSEIVANGVRHGPDGARIRLSACASPNAIRVEVRDEGRPQTITLVEPGDSGGRGLLIVDALSDSWGASTNPTRVWFVLRLRS